MTKKHDAQTIKANRPIVNEKRKKKKKRRE